MENLSTHHIDKLSILHMENKAFVYITYRQFIYMWSRDTIMPILEIETLYCIYCIWKRFYLSYIQCFCLHYA